MTQQEFNDLSKRYLEGRTTPKEDELLTDWYNTQPKQLPLPPLQSQKKEIEKRIWQKIQAQIRPASNGLMIKMAWLAGVAACLVLGFVWFSSDKVPQNNETTLLKDPEQVGIEIKNTTMLEQKVRLEDGTVVMLKQNSSIIYDKNYNKAKREVHLIGEAFFKVKRNVTKPFVVHTGELTTEVLGTSFRIKHYEKAKTIEVSVTTGKVSVYAEKPNRPAERNGVILTTNQRVVFDVASKNIVPSIVDDPVPIVSIERAPPQLDFREASLQQVLDDLSKLYGLEFMIANPNAKDCHITADLNGLSLFTQLELICKSIDATYEKRGTVVFIYGDGC